MNFNIIIPDIYTHIVNMASLSSLINLQYVNKLFHKLISTKPIVRQRNFIKNMKGRHSHTNSHLSRKFIKSCEHGFLDYAMYLFNKYTINIYTIVYVFTVSCEHGQIDVAKWIVKMGESDELIKNNIIYELGRVFVYSCENGHINVAKWLVELGESDYYIVNNISRDLKKIFACSCKKGHINVAKWLVELGESNGYNKIDIHIDNENIFRTAFYNGNIEMAEWLIELSLNGYGEINDGLMKKYLENMILPSMGIN